MRDGLCFRYDLIDHVFGQLLAVCQSIFSHGSHLPSNSG